MATTLDGRSCGPGHFRLAPYCRAGLVASTSAVEGSSPDDDDHCGRLPAVGAQEPTISAKLAREIALETYIWGLLARPDGPHYFVPR